jgi:hypothetical protein
MPPCTGYFDSVCGQLVGSLGTGLVRICEGRRPCFGKISRAVCSRLPL